ncbi:hypothetical protein BGW39_010251 [Mortierella sp. 14UC]|nr:hypothetical protein BGW39_010251 [Mortierella sp. 14UC]
MTNDSLSKKLGLQDIDDRDDINAKQHIRKRDKVREFLGIPKTKTRASNELLNAGLLLTLPVISSQPQSDNNPSGSLIVPADKPTSTSPPPSAETKRPSDIFLENIPKPSLMTDLPALGARIEKTEQLVYYEIYSY